MTPERIEILREAVKKWDIDVENGVVKTKNGAIKRKDRKGYLWVSCKHNGKHYNFYVHQVICFVAGIDLNGKTVNHKDGDIHNNKIQNLEAITHKENMKHAWENGLVKAPASKITEDDVREIRKISQMPYIKQYQIAEMFGISHQQVSAIINYKKWKNVR